MKQIIAVLLLAAALTGCVRQSDLDAANAKLAAADASLAAANKSIDELKAQTAAAQARNYQLSAKLAVKPTLPVKVLVRKAMLGPGLVLVMNTTVKAPIVVLATVQNPTLGTAKRIELHLYPTGPTELGSLQGAVVDSGDVITLSNNDYSPSTFTVR